MHKNHRLQLALRNEEDNILFLASQTDSILAQKIDLIDLQSEIAVRKKMDESIELLEIWRAQVIAARIYKAENNIPDASDEIELAISDIETTVAIEEHRGETIDDEKAIQRTVKQKIREDNSDQMSLF